jgi:SAM-dependent methyltransferase
MSILSKVKQMLHLLEADHNEQTKITRMLDPLSRDLRVLDVGCGLGKKYELLQSIGFTDITGVEKNTVLVEANTQSGRHVIGTEDFFQNYGGSEFDLLVMSHVIEHFQWDELLAFMESYLGLLRDDGYLLIVSPIYHSLFYGDFDHVKPYLPHAIRNFFGSMEQLQTYPRNKLELVDISFRRAPFGLVFFRSLYIQGINRVPRLVNFFLAFLFKLSFRTFGKTTGWIGLFRKCGSD